MEKFRSNCPPAANTGHVPINPSAGDRFTEARMPFTPDPVRREKIRYVANASFKMPINSNI